MMLYTETSCMADYLAKTTIVDYDVPAIIAVAEHLRQSAPSESDLAKSTYEFVRDKISHSADIGGKIVTCKASDVLKSKHGICFAKSHLLAALLRRNGIPGGFCYQLLRLDDDTSPLVLHGLNAVYIGELQRWIRLDARGNKPNVNAQFSTEKEMMAFPVRADLGEIDYPMVFTNPDPTVVDALRRYASSEELWVNLPRELADPTLC